MGRPKVHGSNVERQRAYRARRKAEKEGRPKETHLQKFRRKLVTLAEEYELLGVDPVEIEVALQAIAGHYGMYVYRRSVGDPGAEEFYDHLRSQGPYSGPSCNDFNESVENSKTRLKAYEPWEERERRRKEAEERRNAGTIEEDDAIARFQGMLHGKAQVDLAGQRDDATTPATS